MERSFIWNPTGDQERGIDVEARRREGYLLSAVVLEYLIAMDGSRSWIAYLVPAWLLCAAPAARSELRPPTLGAWERYIDLTEARIEHEIGSEEGFLVADFLPDRDATEFRRTLASGGVFIRKMETLDEEGKKIDVPDGMIHHWYGGIFVPGVELDRVIEWMQNYSDRNLYYDEVERSRLLSRNGDEFQIFLRLKRKKVITVHYDTEHDVVYRVIGPGKAVSKSDATRIAELDRPGTQQEREKPLGQDRGFLWRLSSYWRFQQVDGGVMVDCESVSLSRDIPVAMEWLVKSYLESVPKESLEDTLTPIRRELSPRPSQ